MDKTKVAAGICLALAGLGLYYLLQPVPVPEDLKPAAKKSAGPVSGQGSLKSSQERANHAKVVEIQEEVEKARTNPLSLEEYIEIIKKINNLLIQRMKNHKQEFNTTRRQHRDDMTQYEIIVSKFMIGERKIWDNTWNEVILQEKIPRDLYERAHNEYMNKMEAASEKEKLKLALTLGKAPDGITEEQVREMMEFEIKLLSDAHSVDDIVANRRTITDIEDKIFEKYSIEIEDLRASSELFKDKVKPLTRNILRNYSRFKL